MLERVAASVVLSTEALATKELELVSEHYSLLRIYQNVVVTTATLKVCEVDISTIDIASGEIDAGSRFANVPYVDSANNCVLTQQTWRRYPTRRA